MAKGNYLCRTIYTKLPKSQVLWARGDSNPHLLRDMVLSHAPVPIRLLAQIFFCKTYFPHLLASAPTWARTRDLILKRDLLYQLSYRRVCALIIYHNVPRAGIEPTRAD